MLRIGIPQSIYCVLTWPPSENDTSLDREFTTRRHSSLPLLAGYGLEVQGRSGKQEKSAGEFREEEKGGYPRTGG